MSHTQQQQQHLNQNNDNDTSGKYDNRDDILGLGLEVLGGMSPQFG